MTENKSFSQIVTDYGFPFEQHFVATSDGYILRMFRIKHGKHHDRNTKRPAIILLHGIIDSADNSVVNGQVV
jgi:hypothetical protein